jgi:hypothetical protein
MKPPAACNYNQGAGVVPVQPMTARFIVLSFALAFLTTGCAMFRTPEVSFNVAASAASSGYGVGHIPRSFASAEDDPSLAASFFPKPRGSLANGDWNMTFESLSNGRICFRRTEQSFQDYRLDNENALKDYAVEAHTTLDVPTRPIFPEVVTGHFDSFEFLEKHKEEVKTGGKTIEGDKLVDEHTGRLFFEMRLCGPAPKITPETRFITVSRRGLAPFGSNPDVIPTVLLVWQIDDTGAPP